MTGKFDPRETETALQALLHAFIKASRDTNSDDIHQPEPHGKEGMQAGIRYWGDWQVPEGEDDDGDYDWKEPTPASSARGKALVAEVQKQFPNVELSASAGEKEWINFTATPRTPRG